MSATATLSLGTREDAKYWSRECANQLQYQSGLAITEPDPSLQDIVRFFGRSDNWLFVGGHFTAAKHLYNEAETIKVRFGADKVTVTHGAQTAVLRKGTEFKQHQSIKAIFWGGCNVHSTANIVSD